MIPTVRTSEGRNTGAGCVTGIVSEFMELQEKRDTPNTIAARALRNDLVFIMIVTIRLSAY